MKFVLFGVIYFGLIWSLTSCGVKGDPVPPASPLELGRGKPNYKSDDDTSATSQQKPNQERERKEDDSEDDSN